MALAGSINIFQYIPRLRKTNYWLDRIYDKVGQKTHTINDLVDRVKTLEQNANPAHSNSVKENTEKSPVARGLEQHTKDTTLKIESDKNKLDELIKKSNRSIVSISSVFPWNFFPNTIDVEESRVTFIFRQLFSSQSHSVDIKDISNVFIESGFFFATIQVVSKTFIQNDIKIEYLKKKDAYRTRDIIEGLRTFVQNDINSSKYEINDLITKLNELNMPKALS